MAMLDISIVNVALTDIRASFGTPLDQIGWVSTGYMMANMVVIPMTGWFQRRFGYRRYFAGSILLFTAASALCGTAWSLPSLVAFRVLQGVGGGAIIPTAQSILFARYPREEHSMAGGIFGLGAVTGPLLGPTRGRLAHRRLELALDLPRQRPRRHRGRRARVPLHRGARATRPAAAPMDALRDRPARAWAWRSLQYVLEEGNREGWDSLRILVARDRLGDRARHVLRPRAGDRRPGRGSARLRRPELQRGHGDQLPPRHRALLRLVPVLALLRHGDALHGARHRQDLPGRRRHPDRAHAPAGQVLAARSTAACWSRSASRPRASACG